MIRDISLGVMAAALFGGAAPMQSRNSKKTPPKPDPDKRAKVKQARRQRRTRK